MSDSANQSPGHGGGSPGDAASHFTTEAGYPDPAFLASSVNRASCLSLAKALSIELGSEGILSTA